MSNVVQLLKGCKRQQLKEVEIEEKCQISKSKNSTEPLFLLHCTKYVMCIKFNTIKIFMIIYKIVILLCFFPHFLLSF